MMEFAKLFVNNPWTEQITLTLTLTLTLALSNTDQSVNL